MSTLPAKAIIIDYTNHRGERAERVVIPIDLFFGRTAYHETAQWLMHAWDVARQLNRTFAMKDVHSWRSA